MATYDDNLVLARDQLRFLVGDTDDDQQMLTDNEIAFLFIQANDNLLLACAEACEAIAAKFARDVNFRFSTMWQDSSDAYDHYIDRAKNFRLSSERNTGQPIFSYNENIADGEVPELFWYGMHDNPQTQNTD